MRCGCVKIISRRNEDDCFLSSFSIADRPIRGGARIGSPTQQLSESHSEGVVNGCMRCRQDGINNMLVNKPSSWRESVCGFSEHHGVRYSYSAIKFPPTFPIR